MNQIKTLVFDIDGVLNHGEFFSAMLEDNYAIDQAIQKPFFKGIFQDCLVGKADLKESITPYAVQWGWKGTVEELLSYWFQVEHSVDARLFNYIQAQKNRGVLCIGATNQEKYRCAYMVEQMGFKHIFNEVYASAHLGHAKPDPAFYKKLTQRVGFLPSETLFWDDTPENVQGAKKFGLNAELFTNFDDFKDRMAYYNVDV